jgi:hypothetical protein
LHIPQRHAGIERGDDERVTQGVGSYTLGDPRSSSDAAHDPAGGVTIDPLPVGAHEDRPVAALADREGQWPWPSAVPAALSRPCRLCAQCERALTALKPQVLDVGAESLGRPQGVEG